ncbi:MAG: hypothetical protein ABL962_02220, partial [Fimbriimonadaceae bacterium]
MNFRLGFLGLSIAPLLYGLQTPAPGPIASDAVANMMQRIERGETTLTYHPKRGYLDSVLKELKINPDSQTLVFSKTSLQVNYVNRKNPRALYFNDRTYVGWIPGAPLIEVMTINPEKGIIFYTIRNEQLAKPRFEVDPRQCFQCHGRRSESQIPILFARSAFIAPSGYPQTFARAITATPDVPIEDRWGGWYVSGTHGAVRHRGNEVAVGEGEDYKQDFEKGANVTDLSGYVDTSSYLSSHSDIAALMVLEQQMDIQNTLSSTIKQVRQILAEHKDGQLSGEALKSFTTQCEYLVGSLLGDGEAKLSEALKGTSTFAESYSRSAPACKRGRRLSELDLKTRVHKYG